MMKKKGKHTIRTLFIGFMAAIMVYGFTAGDANATNGDNLIGIGPIARSMGGVGVAAPQDAISAVFSNPAGMCFGPYCPGSEFNFAGTVFDPTVKASVSAPLLGINTQAESKADPFVIPAIGISMPINPKLRFGLAAFGVSGMGVDYRDQLDYGAAFGPDQEGEIYTQYQVMKFAPNLAYLITNNLSVGASVHVGYAALDLGQGNAHGYGFGIQVGALYKLGPLSFGASYISPQKVTHERVYNFNADLNGDGASTGPGEDTISDNLDLEAPQNLTFGIAYKPFSKFLVETDVKWINWSDAEGYKDFEWDDQWVFGIGVQYKPIKKLALRAGFNYGENPVKIVNGRNGAALKTIQGKQTTQFGYEYLRIVGFPAVAEKHMGLGIGYQLTDTISLNLGYKHAFDTKITETVNNFAGTGAPITIQSELSEDSYEFGLTKRF